jgi:DNA-binding transcriptional LysR family regulator
MADLGGRSGELQVFVAIVASGGVSAGARSLGLVPSTASRMLRRLETRVGARLVVREGRTFRLTREGETCYQGARRILAEMDELEQTLGDGVRPRGLLRVSASVAFGRLYILPLLDAFGAAFPDVTVQVSLTDRVADVIGGETDLAIRVGQLPDSDLKVRKLAESPRIIVASPDYLKRHGTPVHPRELERHSCLRLLTPTAAAAWPFVEGSAPFDVTPRGNIVVDNGEALVQLAIRGFGLARVGRFHVAEPLATGELVPLLEHFTSSEKEVIQAVFVGQPSVPGRIRAFVDFLTTNIDLQNPTRAPT